MLALLRQHGGMCAHVRAQELEDFYRGVHARDGCTPRFPRSYPRGALIGCVDVIEILTARFLCMPLYC
jgi:hypothetical protein